MPAEILLGGLCIISGAVIATQHPAGFLYAVIGGGVFFAIYFFA